MKTPLCPGFSPGYDVWTIVHETGSVIFGTGGYVAFTTREAFEAWARGDIILRDSDWIHGPPESIFHAEAELLIPGRYVLILEETWAWKFPTECPRMSSAEDGQEVLGKLLEGKRTPAQVALANVTWMQKKLLDRPTPEHMFISASQWKVEWDEYRRLAQWKPDAVVGPDGGLVLLRAIDCDYATFIGHRVSFDAPLFDSVTDLDSPLLEGEELMVIERISTSNHLWSPQNSSRRVPMYLAALA